MRLDFVQSFDLQSGVISPCVSTVFEVKVDKIWYDCSITSRTPEGAQGSDLKLKRSKFSFKKYAAKQMAPYNFIPEV